MKNACPEKVMPAPRMIGDKLSMPWTNACRIKQKREQRLIYTGMVRTIQKLVYEADFDFPIVISGSEGCGKSACAVNLACDLDKDFKKELEDRLVWGGEEQTDSIWHMGPGAVVNDESGIDLFSRDSMKGENKKIVKVLMLCRTQNQIPIFVVPNVNWIDKYIREHRAQMWIKVSYRTTKDGRARGFANVYLPENHDFRSTWWQSCFVYRFPDFPEDIKNTYLSMKEKEGRQKAMQYEQENKKEPYERGNREQRNTCIVNAYKDGMKQTDIARAHNLTSTMVHKILVRAGEKK